MKSSYRRGKKSGNDRKIYARCSKVFQYVEEMGKKEGITKEIVLSYKRSLIEEYAPSSVNSMLASLNHFLK